MLLFPIYRIDSSKYYIHCHLYVVSKTSQQKASSCPITRTNEYKKQTSFQSEINYYHYQEPHFLIIHKNTTLEEKNDCDLSFELYEL